MAVDKFANFDDQTSPARKVYVITPHASNEVDPIPKAIRADSAGTITFRAVDSTSDVVMTFAAGEQLDVRVQYVRVTGTTVALIHGLA
jgi:hypothetical protein